MGKATRWFRNLLGLKPNPNPTSKPTKDKQRRWSFVKSYREKSNSNSNSNSRLGGTPTYNDDVATTSSAAAHDEATKHAIAVAAATAAVAEAAVAAAQAAAAVVRLTHSGPPPRISGPPPRISGGWERRVWGAVVIQSRFRGYLARRALRALKGLVKLQALVRGHIMRRKTAETMRCMQAMLRAQARARTVRAYLPESPQSSSKSGQLPQPEPPTPEKSEKFVRAKSAKPDQSPKIKRNSSRPSSRTNTTNQERSNFGSSWSDPRMEDPTYDPRMTSSSRTCKTDEDRADRILEIDTGRPPSLRRKTHFESHHHPGLLTSDNLTRSYTTSKDSHPTVLSPSVSCEVVQSLNPLKFLEETDGGHHSTAENSPQFNSAKSDGSRSLLSGYSDCPSYMSYTESSRAKVRSLSAPKQRPHNERPSSTKRYSVHGLGEHNPRSSRSRSSAMQARPTSKTYPGSGHLDRLGMPVRDSTVVYYSGYLN